MTKGIFQQIKDHYNHSSGRSKELTDNIILSLAMKFASIVASLLLVPMTINYVNPTQYGIWLTLSSVIGWMTYFDLGLGNGFRNKFAEAKANGDTNLAREYVSTTYFAISFIVMILFIIVLIINKITDWSSILKLPIIFKLELQRIFVIVSAFTCLNMIANIFGTLLTADQKPGLTSIIQGIGQWMSLLAIFILTKVSKGSLTNLALYYSGIPCLVMLIASIIMFSCSKYKYYSPEIKYIKTNLIRSILQLGVQFFIIYMCLIAIFQIINIVITRELGAESVTQYNVCNKYFNIIYMVASIISTPLWSAFTEAYTRNDYPWMSSMIKKMEKLWFLSIIIGLVMLATSEVVYRIWIGSSIVINYKLSASMLFLILIQTIGNVYMSMINGIGTIRVQLIIYMIFAIVAWPLFTICAKTFGLVGVVIVPSIVNLVQAIAGKIQLNKLMSKTAKGVWLK